MLKMIMCVDANNGIAKDNKLAWNIKSEMNHFKKTTTNKIIVMGHNTFKSIGRVLPKRKNIVFSNNLCLKIKGATVTNDVKKIIKLSKNNDVFIIGGKQICNLFINYIDELILTVLNNDYDCDLFWKPNLKFFEVQKTKEFDQYKIYYYRSIYHKIIDGKKVQEHIINSTLNKIEMCKNKPRLEIIQVGDDFASSVYIRNKLALAAKLNINAKLTQLNSSVTFKKLAEVVNKLNVDKKIHGILIQSPLPKHLNENEIANLINPLKDVDCFNRSNMGMLFKSDWDNLKAVSCTPQGVMEMIKYYNIPIVSKHAVIIGRSNIVSKPLAMLLLKANATVTICHSKTKNLSQFTKSADLIFSAVGSPNLIKAKDIKKNSIIFDIGINRDSNNKLCGDVDFHNVLKKVKLITPVPGGVGLTTLACLFKNLVNLYLEQEKN